MTLAHSLVLDCKGQWRSPVLTKPANKGRNFLEAREITQISTSSHIPFPLSIKVLYPFCITPFHKTHLSSWKASQMIHIQTRSILYPLTSTHQLFFYHILLTIQLKYFRHDRQFLRE